MKKLTIKALKEMLDKSYMLNSYIGVLKKQNTFYVVFDDKVASYRYSKVCGWCFHISGFGMYADTKALLKIVVVLDEQFKGDNEND